MALSVLDGLQRDLYRTADHPPLVWRAGDTPDAPLFWSTDGSRSPGPWHADGAPLPVQLEGPHQVANIAAAIAAGLHFGVAESDICDALVGFQPVRQRGETVRTDRNTVIVDCYNANPSSVESTLRAFSAAGHDAPTPVERDTSRLNDRPRRPALPRRRRREGTQQHLLLAHLVQRRRRLILRQRPAH